MSQEEAAEIIQRADDGRSHSASRSRSRDREQGEQEGVTADNTNPHARERTEIILAAHAVPDGEVWNAAMDELSRMTNWQRALRLYILLIRYWRLMLAHPDPEHWQHE